MQTQAAELLRMSFRSFRYYAKKYELIARDRVVKALGLPKAQRYATIPNIFDWATQRGMRVFDRVAGEQPR